MTLVRSPTWTVGLGVGTVCLANVDASAFSLAVPLLHRAFPESSFGALGLIQSAYGLGFACAILPAGHVVDRRGPRVPLLAGLLVFAAANLLGTLSTTVAGVIIARAFAGSGIACAVPGALAMLLSDAGATERRRRVGQWGAAGALAAGGGPLIGGIVGQAVGWRGLFLLAVLPAAAIVVAAWPHVGGTRPDVRPSSERVDKLGWLRRRGVQVATVASAAVGATVYAVQIMTGLVLVDQARFSVFLSGIVLAPAFLLSGWLALRVGYLRTSGSVGLACGCAGIGVLISAAAGILAAQLALVALGTLAAATSVVGLAAAATCVSTAAALAAGPDVGRVTALNQVARQVGGAAGAGLLGVCIGHRVTSTSLRAGWSLIATSAVIVVLLAVPLANSASLPRARNAEGPQG